MGDQSDEADALQWAAGLPGVHEEPGPLSIGEERDESANFPPVPAEILNRDWSVIGRHKWKRQQSMPILEGRATLFAVKHFLRKVSNHHRKHLIFSDSMSAICAIDRGRGKTHGLRRVTQQIGALLLATGSTISIRWVASELNPADGPSRGSLFASRPTVPVAHGDPQVDTIADPENKKPNEGGKKGQVQNSCLTSQESAERGRQESSGSPTESTAGVSGQPGSSINWCYSKTALCNHVGAFQVLNQFAHQRSDQSARRGCSTLSSSSRDVFGRAKFECCAVHGCISAFSCASVQVPPNVSFTDFETDYAGLEETGPSPFTSSFASRSGMLDGQTCISNWEDPRGAEDAPSHGGLPPSCGNHTNQGHGFRPASARKSRSKMVHRAPSSGDAVHVQSPRVRRDHFDGPARSRDPCRNNLPSVQTGIPPELRARLQSEFSADDGRDAGSLSPLQSAKPGATACLQTQACGSVPRFFAEVADHVRHSTSRPLEGKLIHTPLPKRRKTATNDAPTSRRGPARSSSGLPRSSANTPRPPLMYKLPKDCPVYVEIFSGSGYLSQSVARFTCWFVLLWDISLGPAYDLRVRANRHLLGNWVRSGVVVGFHLGMPCDSFTRARDVPPGPPPLRSDQHPLGLPGLSARDQLKVIVGNLWMRFSVWMLRLAIAFNVFATLENPQRSRLWLCPPVLALMRHRAVHLHVTHYCYWGKPFKKATSWLAVNFLLHRMDPSLCSASKRGLCPFSHAPHLQMCGRDHSGQWLTRMAQPYPVKMCHAIAKCLHDAEVERIAQRFQNKWAKPG